MRNLVLVAFLLFSSTAWAQNAKLVGRIIDNAGLPLPGATLRVGDLGAISDVEGRYTLLGLKAGEATLVVTYIGFEKVETTLTLTEGTNTYDLSNQPMRPPLALFLSRSHQPFFARKQVFQHRFFDLRVLGPLGL